jgi:hypothetical protein
MNLDFQYALYGFLNTFLCDLYTIGDVAILVLVFCFTASTCLLSVSTDFGALATEKIH